MKRHLDFIFGIPLVKALSLFSNRNTGSQDPPRRILVIKLAAFGDSVLLIPTLRALRQAMPTATLDYLCSPVNRTLVSTIPYINRMIVLKNFSPGSLFALTRELRDNSYDLVIDFEEWARGTGILSWLSRAPRRVGFDTPGQHRAALYTDTLTKRFDRHESDEFLALASLAVPLRGPIELELWETQTGRDEISSVTPEILTRESQTPRVLLHPGCGSDGYPREWPLEKYRLLAQWIKDKYAAKLFISGGPEEVSKGASLSQNLKESSNVAGRLSWHGMISLVKHMDLVISGNTGVMHIAAAWKIPQVALHGPTNPRLWGPLNPHSKIVSSSCPKCPCLRLGFEYHRKDSSCMDLISLDAVKQAVQELLAKRSVY